jgi:integrase
VSDWGGQFLRGQRPRLTPKTFALYESLYRNCIADVLGAVPLDAVRKSAVRDWVAGLSTRGLSASRVRQALGLLSQIMDAAVDDELIVVNPCRGVRAPRVPITEPRILAPEEVAQLAAAMRPPFGLLVELLAYGGLRIGEAFALRRECVDLNRHRLVIRESLSETAGHLSFGPTKTHQRRTVTLPAFLAAALERHLENHVPESAEALLFVGRTGQPVRYNAFRTWHWDPAVQAVGLTGVTPHDLRATCASWVADTAGVLEAAKRLGHARTSVTTRHYARPVEGRDRDVAARLDTLRHGATDAQSSPDLAREWHAGASRGRESAAAPALTCDNVSEASEENGSL